MHGLQRVGALLLRTARHHICTCNLHTRHHHGSGMAGFVSGGMLQDYSNVDFDLGTDCLDKTANLLVMIRGFAPLYPSPCTSRVKVQHAWC
jgi:hypothetical protein